MSDDEREDAIADLEHDHYLRRMARRQTDARDVLRDALAAAARRLEDVATQIEKDHPSDAAFLKMGAERCHAALEFAERLLSGEEDKG